jgi:DNA topoisomerase IB
VDAEGYKLPPIPPGKQLPPKIEKKLRQMGITKFPESAIPEHMIEVNLNADPETEPFLKWHDKAGRPQSAYHPEFHARTAKEKWARIKKHSGGKIGRIGSAVADALDDAVDRMNGFKPGTDEHAAHTIAALLAETGGRPGWEPGTTRHSGIWSLKTNHVKPQGDGRVLLQFTGKSGKVNRYWVTHEATKKALMHYVKTNTRIDHRIFDVEPHQVRKAIPAGKKVKDNRTMVATAEAERHLSAIKPEHIKGDTPEARLKSFVKHLREVSKKVARRICNTGSVALKSYIHPEIIKQYAAKLGVDYK